MVDADPGDETSPDDGLADVSRRSLLTTASTGFAGIGLAASSPFSRPAAASSSGRLVTFLVPDTHKEPEFQATLDVDIADAPHLEFLMDDGSRRVGIHDEGCVGKRCSLSSGEIELSNPLDEYEGEVHLDYESSGDVDSVTVEDLNYDLSVQFYDWDVRVGEVAELDTKLNPGTTDVGYAWKVLDEDGEVVLWEPLGGKGQEYDPDLDSITHTFEEAGTYTAEISVQDSWGNIDYEDMTFEVTSREFSFTVDGPSSVTLEPIRTTATYTIDDVEGAANAPSYDWEVERPDGTTESEGTGSAADVSFGAAGSHTVFAEGSDGVSTHEASTDVWVPSTFEVSGMEGPTSVATGKEVSFSVEGENVGLAGSSVDWEIDPSSSTSSYQTAADLTVTFEEPGEYDVEAVVSDAATSESVRTTVEVFENQAPQLDVANVRLVQDVTDSRVCSTDDSGPVPTEVDRGVELPDPDLVYGRQTTVAFDLRLTNGEYVDWTTHSLEETVVRVEIEQGSSTSVHELSLGSGADRTEDRDGIPTPVSLHDANAAPFDYGQGYVVGNDYPTFELDSDDVSASVTVVHDDGSASASSGGYAAHEMPTMDVAFAPLVDPRLGFGPGFDDHAPTLAEPEMRDLDPDEVQYDADLYGPDLDLSAYESQYDQIGDLDPEQQDRFLQDVYDEYLEKMEYERRVEDVVRYLERWFPVAGVDEFIFNDPIVGHRTEKAPEGSGADEHVLDMQTALEAVHDLTGDDTRVVLLAPPDYNEFYGKWWSGLHVGDSRGVVVSADNEVTVAHELGHVLNEDAYQHPGTVSGDEALADDHEHMPLAKLAESQRHERNFCESCEETSPADGDYCLDNSHARSSGHTVDLDEVDWSEVDQSEFPFDYHGATDEIERVGGLQSTGFVIGTNSIETHWARDVTMAYDRDTTTVVPDARMVDDLMAATNGDSFEDEGYDEEEQEDLLEAVFRTIEDAIPLSVASVSSYQGAPMRSDPAGDVTVEVLDGDGAVLAERSTDTMASTGCAADGSQTATYDDMANVAVEYPEETARLRIDWADPPNDGVDAIRETVVPIECELSATLDSIPSRAVRTSSSYDSDDLLNLAAAVAPLVEGAEYTGALDVLQSELRDAVDTAVPDRYTAAGNETSLNEARLQVAHASSRVHSLREDGTRTVSHDADEGTVSASDGSFAATVTGFSTSRAGDQETFEVLTTNAANDVDVTWEVRAPGDDAWQPVADAGSSTTARLSFPETGVYAIRVTADDGRSEDVSAHVVTVEERLTVDDRVPTQVDGSQRYWDFTGDGSVTNADVTEFFGEIADPTVNANPRYFDYDGNGDVGQSDVQALFDAV